MGAELNFTSWWKDGQRIGRHVLKPLQSALWSEIIFLIHEKYTYPYPRSSFLKKSHVLWLAQAQEPRGVLI